MIIKTYQLEKIRKKYSNFYLLYGENEGYKNQVIKDILTIDFKDNINRYDESEVINNFDNLFVTAARCICYNECHFKQFSFISWNDRGIVNCKIYKSS